MRRPRSSAKMLSSEVGRQFGASPASRFSPPPNCSPVKTPTFPAGGLICTGRRSRFKERSPSSSLQATRVTRRRPRVTGIVAMVTLGGLPVTLAWLQAPIGLFHVTTGRLPVTLGSLPVSLGCLPDDLGALHVTLGHFPLPEDYAAVTSECAVVTTKS